MRRKVTVALVGAIAALAVAAVATSIRTPSTALAAPVAPARTKVLLVRYATKSTCTIVPNYPKPGVVGNSTRTWTIPPRGTIIWRYNVNSTWSAVSDPSRAARRQFPWWGFTRRGCIGNSIKQKGYPAGKPVPKRILQGRSQLPTGWRHVTFSLPPAHVIARHHKVRSSGTLRDPNNFVIGNVFATWHVNVTSRTRSNGFWTQVYVPNAKRWGYLETSKLH